MREAAMVRLTTGWRGRVGDCSCREMHLAELLLRTYDAVLKAAFAPDYKILTVFLSRFGAETAVGNHLQRWEQMHGRSVPKDGHR